MRKKDSESPAGRGAAGSLAGPAVAARSTVPRGPSSPSSAVCRRLPPDPRFPARCHHRRCVGSETCLPWLQAVSGQCGLSLLLRRQQAGHGTWTRGDSGSAASPRAVVLRLRPSDGDKGQEQRQTGLSVRVRRRRRGWLPEGIRESRTITAHRQRKKKTGFLT